MSATNMKTVNVLEFERREAHLSEEQDEPPYTIHGVALGSGDVTHGSSGVKKMWPGEELKKAAETLQGKNLVVDHNNSASGVVGRVTKAGYKEGTGVVYEAKLYDEELVDRVKDGLLEVSIRGYHIDVDEMEENGDGVKIVEDIQFDNLSIVPQGASPSNTLEMGEHAELSVEELSDFTDTLEAELQEIESSDFVQWGDMHGIVFKVEDGSAMIEVMEEIDGMWRAVGEQKEVSLDDLEMWDLDESDIGEPMDEEENIAEDEKVMWDSSGGTARGVVVDRKTEGCFADRIDGDVKVCASDEEDVYLINVVQETDNGWERSDTMVAHKENTLSETDFKMARGTSENMSPENFMFQSEDRAIQMSKQLGLGGDTHTMEVEGVDYYMPGATHEEFLAAYMQAGADLSAYPEELNRHLMDRKHPMKDEEVPSPPMWEDGMLVEWQVEPQLFGRVVHVDRKRQIVMVEIHEMKNGELIPTGFTISAGFSDIQQFDRRSINSGHAMDEEKEMMEENMSLIQEGMTFFDTVNDSTMVVKSVDGNIATITTDDETQNDSWEEEVDNIIRKLADGEWEHSGNRDSEEMESYDDYPEAAKENAQMALDAREETGNPRDCGTNTGWMRANQLASGESLSRDTVERMAQFNRHRQNSDMSDEEGESDCGWMMWKAWGGDEGVDWAIRKSESFEENSSEELEGTVHKPEFSGMDDAEWSKPALNDFTDESWDDLSDDEKSSIGNHFIASMSGFPADNYSDMKLPIVRPDGTLSMNAVRNAKARLSQTDGLSSDQKDEIESMLDSLMDEDEMASNVPQLVGVSVLTSDDFREAYKSGESEMDSKFTKVITMTELSDELQARLEELENPVAFEQDDLDELQEKAEKYDDISEDISELRERTEVLDEVDRDLVDELASSDEPMVIESSRYESLSDEAEQVKKVYASNLAEELGAFSAEELMDKFSIEELRDKHEEEVGDLEEELSPDPKGGDVDEEELDEGDDKSEEELERSEEIKQKQEEMRQRIFG